MAGAAPGAEHPVKYAKTLDGVVVEYQGPGERWHGRGPFELRITLGDMDLEQAFTVALQSRLSKITIGSLLNEVFSEDEQAQTDLEAALDVAVNPDLPDIYEELLDIFDQWRRGDCTLRFFANHGPRVELDHTVAQHVGARRPPGEEMVGLPVLDLVIDQTYEVLAWFAEGGGDTADLLMWLRGTTLLYFMDKHGFRLPVSPEDELDRGLLEVAADLVSRGLIVASEMSGVYEFTDEGGKAHGQTIAETESYIETFDVFSDVLVHPETGEAEFGTGVGDDLRVQVYESEGLNPIRVVFLLRLYDSTLDDYADRWRQEIHREEFFNEVLRPVLDHRWVDDDLMGPIIESGYAHSEEMAEEARERAFQRDALRRIQSE